VKKAVEGNIINLLVGVFLPISWPLGAVFEASKGRWQLASSAWPDQSNWT
jgi:hypothetical protein